MKLSTVRGVPACPTPPTDGKSPHQLHAKVTYCTDLRARDYLLVAVSTQYPGGDSEFEPAIRKRLGHDATAPSAHHGPRPGKQLGQTKQFGDVVVRAQGKG